MSLEVARDRLASLLKDRDIRVVFAESCTAGLCSATLAQVNGISPYLCGSAATYVPELKQAWLNVNPDTMEQYTCESQEVANEMALGVLDTAAVAEWSASVVGHLAGDLPCQAFVAIARREADGEATIRAMVNRPLRAESRQDRQREAAEMVLQLLCDTITMSNRP